MGAVDQVVLSQAVRGVLSHFANIPAVLHLPVAGQAGSGRKYYRIAFGAQTWILQQSHAGDADFDRFVSYCNLFAALELSTPRIHAVDRTLWQVLLDDLGSTQLWDRCLSLDPVKGSHPNAGYSAALYSEVLQALTRWQESSDMAFAESSDLASRDFDFHALRWETGYFAEHFLQGYCGVEPSPADSYGQIFDSLAKRVAEHPRGLMHRDFQSQNVMVDARNSIGFVDFQGARRGSLYYDIASLLWDPYVWIDADSVQQWFMAWVGTNPLLMHEDIDHWTCFLEASLQRLMQAMGAYCNLSRNKGIVSFAAHIKPGGKKLEMVVEAYSKTHNALDVSFLVPFLEMAGKK